MSELYKVLARPRLKSPILVAAWPGIANVAMLVAAYMGKKLDFKPLAEINAAYFFDPIGVMAKDSVIQAPQFPQSHFLYYKNKTGENDIILFVGTSQPVTKTYEMANSVLEVAQRFHVQRIYTCAAAITRIHHTEESRVWGVATLESLVGELKQRSLIQKSAMQIAGLNGLLLGVAREQEIEGICLLGEVPSYAAQFENPMAALAIIRVLSDLLGVKINTHELERVANGTREKMKEAAAEAMGEYIDLFTEPIWEQGDEEDDYEDNMEN